MHDEYREAQKLQILTSGRLSGISADEADRYLRGVNQQGAKYSPNHIPRWERFWNTVFSVTLLAYGVYGLSINDLYMPGKHGPGVHLHGLTAWVMFAAMLCACANMISLVIDHYDVRNNETNYRKFARVTQIAGYVFFAISFVMSFTDQQ